VTPGGARRAPAVAGIVAMVVGAVLIGVAVTDPASRPEVLGEVVTAPTTTSIPPAPTSPTTAPRGQLPSTPEFSARNRRETPPTTEKLQPSTPTSRSTSTSTPTSTPASSTPTSTASSTSTSTTAVAPCPAGEPVAAVRTWDAAADADGVWHVTVTGVVSNRTGATVEVDAVAIVFTRADGSTYEVPPEQRPRPDPPVVNDGGEASWRYDGAVPSGAQPTGVTAAVAGWRAACP
jgi:hypothetical protein